ncbi:PREDICTED: TBC1 domain family member 5 homolog B-like [Nelumbo nucifera]|uniref:TBC1 domain family member 5 homolog B-like n=1 Tax=Nelumbo nucifera TaxID=4432 RepID=A0A1U8BK66_NELNU|nr:PREDICTED: TBC1 domain family member 5 homolog B-like [Nelumbo nucifera]
MSPAPIEVTLPESPSVSSPLCSSSTQRCGGESRFSNLRSVQWRINLGILPSSSSIEELRRVTADTRRRYAGLRRRLLVDPHFLKEGNNSPDLIMDNPLSQNPDSMWGRFFRNAELEKMVDQDLSRLYPEHGSYFQMPACQGMLRRILLLWCLRHPEYGYRQGMHELLAPLLFVLHVDVQCLSQVRKIYEDHFTDKFDGLSLTEGDVMCDYKFMSTPDSSNWGMGMDENNLQGSTNKVSSLDELNPEVQTIILLSDAYGAEGELGILLSERFMEHDAYCMFDALMSGARGTVAMADYFSSSPTLGSQTGLPPVIEASSALYHLLSIVDSSLHSHLVELGVEPQYFALRWLRVLFGREFLLEDLLIIWDEIFAADNSKLIASANDDDGSGFGVLGSPRGAFISAMAVSMLLHLRSSLLATETATACLQRLLNFPENANVKKLIEKAKSLQSLALDTSISSLSPFLYGAFDRKSTLTRVHSLSSGSISPRTPLKVVPESYWEEKWRVLHKAEELHQGSSGKQVPSGKKGSSGKVRLSLARAESDPSPAKTTSVKKDSRSFVRRRLLEDLSRELGFQEDVEKPGCSDQKDPICSQKDPLSSVNVGEQGFLNDSAEKNCIDKNFTSTAVETSLSGHTGSEENSSIFSASSSPLSGANDHENDSEKSSVSSNLYVDDNDGESNNLEQCGTALDDTPLPVSYPTDATLQQPESDKDSTGKQETILKERKLHSGKFQWFWRFGRGGGEGASEKGGNSEVSRSTNVGGTSEATTDKCDSSGLGGTGDSVDKNVLGTLRNLGHTMLENIQVLESVFQHDRGQVGSLENLSRNILVGKGQVTAMAALKELRKISNLLSEM